MNGTLPQAFIAKMRQLLGKEAEAFLASYEEERAYGLRVNTLKISPSAFACAAPFSLTPVPWCPSGFYYQPADRPGRHPYHAAGLYYIQEPSAMAVVEALAITPGERVLDLAAAPGGKATQAAQALRGEGVLIANEIHPSRARILSENIERMGIRNALVTNEPPDRLAGRFPAFFDKVIVDAPCSGEGMFRKVEEARLEWSEENVVYCAQRQADILDAAAEMVRPGGRLVYSTCTFSPLENEQAVARFLDRHHDYELIPIALSAHFSPGRAEWAEGSLAWPLERCCRLWPHRLRGEGHFIALFERRSKGRGLSGLGGSDQKKGTGSREGKKGRDVEKAWQLFKTFAAECLAVDLGETVKGRLHLFGEQLYILPDHRLDIRGLKLIRPGWHLGTVKKRRFEPSHALALSLRSEDVKQTCDLKSGDQWVEAYLHGETLPAEGKKGWALVTVDGYPLGWGKASGGQLKNHYPKGLRNP